MIQIWHNPRCSKSRASMEVIENSSYEYKVKKYLDEDITCSELKDILKKLRMNPNELMRTKEEIYKDLDVANIADEDKLIEIMVQNPKLIERPIIVKGSEAVIGRPVENTINFLS